MYIHERVKLQRAAMEAACEEIGLFEKHLLRPKFQGVCEDYINVKDVLAYLVQIKGELEALE